MISEVIGAGHRRNFTCIHFGRVLLLCGTALLAGCETAQSPAPTSQTGEVGKLVEPTLRAAAANAEASQDYAVAAKHYNTLLQRNPGDLELTQRLARALRYAGKSEAVIQLLTPMVDKVDAPPAPLLLELGAAHLAADHLSLARRYLERARDLAPGSWEVHSALGVTYDYMDLYADAQQSYLEALAASPDNPTVLNNLALSQAQAGDLAGAIDTLRKATTVPQASAQTRQNLALMLALSGDVEAAERYARMDLPPDVLRERIDYFRSLQSGN